ncbi:tape measure protein [Pediococcus claussenii]|uniref:tape measure protein n=1 Tax=Pediococcus claussenii TaxID=187452 RepID=UPI00081AA3B1|nr:tape measure protein [Pediococcus claussenii]ANZ70377.1 hypothetical protein AYR57_08635 [Pediococcus claussenii]ANZ72193.1 hypothetical protein AYR58_08635 [Pediococcus claussenii]
MDTISGYKFAFEMDDGGMVRTMKEMRNEAKMLKSAMKSNFAELASGGNMTKAYEQKLKDLGNAVKAEKTTIKEARAEQEKLDTTTEKGRAEFTKLQGTIDRAKISITGYESQTNKAQESLKYYKTGIDKVNESIKITTTASKAYVDRLRAEGKEFQANKAELKGLDSEYGKLESRYKKQESLLADIAKESGKTSDAYTKQKTKLDQTGAAMARAKTDMSKLNEIISRANPSIFSRMSRSLLGLNKSAEHTQSVFKSVFSGAFWGNMASSAFSSAVNYVKNGFKAMATAGIEYNKELQKVKIGMSNFTNNTDKTRQLMDVYKGLRSESGYASDSIALLTKKAYALTKSTPETKKLGDAFVNLGRATGLSDEKLTGLITKFSQANASGQVTTGSLTKLEKALPGFNAALSKSMGKSRDDITAMAKDGQLKMGDLQKAIITMSNSKPNGLRNYYTTYDGFFNHLHEKFDELSGQMTAGFFNKNNSFLSGLSKMLDGKEIEDSFKRLGNSISKATSTIFNSFGKVFNSQNMHNTFAKAIDTISDSVEKMADVISKHAKEIVEFFKGVWAGAKVLGQIGIGFFKGLIDGLKMIVTPIAKMTGHTKAINSLSDGLEDLSKHSGALQTLGKVLAGIFITSKALKFAGAVATASGKLKDLAGWGKKAAAAMRTPEANQSILGDPNATTRAGKLPTKITGFGNQWKALNGYGKLAAGAVGAGMIATDALDISDALKTKNPKKKFEDYGGVAGSTIGGAIGFWFGGPEGAALGASIGRTIGRWAGAAAKSFSDGWDKFNNEHPLKPAQVKGNTFEKSGYEFNRGVHGGDSTNDLIKQEGWFKSSFDLRLWANEAGQAIKIVTDLIGAFMKFIANPIGSIKSFFKWLGSFKLPKWEMPKWLNPKSWKLPKISMPKLGKIKAPKLPGWLNWKEWHWPKFKPLKFPKFKLPKLPGWLNWKNWHWPKISGIKFPTIKWPKLPKWMNVKEWHWPKLSIPKMPKISWPKIPKWLSLKEFKWPHFGLPKIGKLSWPKLPKWVTNWKWPKIPTFKFPTIKWPSLPKWLKLPTFKWPKFNLPKIPKINWPKPPEWLSDLNPFGKKKKTGGGSTSVVSKETLKNAKELSKLKFPSIPKWMTKKSISLPKFKVSKINWPKLPKWLTKKTFKLPKFNWSSITKGMSKQFKSMDKSASKTTKSINKYFKNAVKVKWSSLSSGLSKQLKNISKSISKTTKDISKTFKKALKIKWSSLSSGLSKVLKSIEKSVTKTAKNMQKTLKNALKVKLNWASSIKKELNSMLKQESSFAGSFNKSWKSLWNDEVSVLRSAFGKMSDTFSSWDSKTEKWFGSFSRSFEKAWKSLSNNLQSTWKSMWKSIDDLSNSGMHKAVNYINGGIKGIDYVLGRFGGSSGTISPIHFATGTGLLENGRLTRDTMAVLNDGHDSPETGNKERIVHKDGTSEEVLGVNTPRLLRQGDGVLNATENKVWSSFGVPRFADGTNMFNSKFFKGITGGYKSLIDVATNVGSHIEDSFAGLFGAAPTIKGAVEQDFSENVFDKSVVKDGVPWWKEVWKLINEAIGSGSSSDLLKAVEKYGRGHRYVWGATGPDTFDCSGLVMYALKKAFNIDYPHFSGSQIAKAQSISKDELKPGDLIGNDEHIGVYAGKGQYWSAMSPSNNPNIGMAPTGYFPGTPKYGRVKGIHGSSDSDYQDVGKNTGLEGFVKNELGKPMFQWIEKNLAPLADTDGGAGGSYSPSLIAKAASMAGVNPDASFTKMLQQTIQSESGGKNIIQSIHDMNSGGNEARGILQFTPQTFKAFAVKGHTNIMNPLDQLLAFFNNSDWKNSIGQTNIWGTNKVDWLHSGPQGHARYANGGIVNQHQFAEIAEGNMAESIIPWDILKRSRANQLLKQTVNHFEKTDPNFNVQDLSNKSVDNSIVEDKLDRVINLFGQLIQTVINKPTGITDGQIFDSYNKTNRSTNKLKNMGKGQYGLS